MGPGPRIDFNKSESFGVGVFFTTFPYQVSIHIQVAIWSVSIGLGKPYTEY